MPGSVNEAQIHGSENGGKMVSKKVLQSIVIGAALAVSACTEVPRQELLTVLNDSGFAANEKAKRCDPLETGDTVRATWVNRCCPTHIYAYAGQRCGAIFPKHVCREFTAKKLNEFCEVE